MNEVVDWSVLQLEGVDDVARKAASKVASEFRGVVEADDLYQDTVIRMAKCPATVRGYVQSGNVGMLYRWAYSRLVDQARVEASRRNRQVSYEVAREGVE